MILIADSGSTKTHWCLKTRSEQRSDFMTEGINPFHQSEEAIRHILTEVLLPQLGKYMWVGPIERIYFYGAGCTPEKCIVMKGILESVFKHATAEVHSDMVGAAIGVLGKEKGVACILGTGSNSCLWDGEKIVKQVPSLGYILGDEGSGAVLGRTLAGDALKGLMGENLRTEFLNWVNRERETSAEDGKRFENPSEAQGYVIERVYRQPMANRYLAGLSKFCAAHRGEEAIEQLLKRHFGAFRDRVLEQYCKGEGLTVSFVGSIAWYYRDVIEEVLAEKGYRVGKIVQEPIEGLIEMID